MDGNQPGSQWHPVCALDEIWPDTGICALVEGRQIAIFRLRADADHGERLFAIDNHDPKSGANVLSRGLVGNLGGRLVVAAPIYKQHYDLATGECLEEPEIPVRSYAVRADHGRVWVAA